MFVQIFPGAVDDPLDHGLFKSACRSLTMSTMHGNSAAMAARDWAHALIPYRRASAARAILELAVTVLPFIALWAAMVSLRRATVSTGFLVRYGAVL